MPQAQRGPQVQLSLARDLFVHMGYEAVSNADILTVPVAN